jgi:hypothetical protein
VPAAAVKSEQRNLLVVEGLSQTEQRIYALLSIEEPKRIDDLGETTELNSREVPATLFELEMKALFGSCPESSLQRFCCSAGRRTPNPPDASEPTLRASEFGRE